MRTTWIVLAALGVATIPAARAGNLADALARPDQGAVEALRAQRDDTAARCTLGAVYGKRGDLPRAHLYLAGCGELALPPEVASEIAKIARAVQQQLRDGDLSPIEILTKPEGLIAEISALPGETFTTPATVWVKAGTHEIKATASHGTFTTTVTAGVRSRALAIVDTGPAKPPAAARAGHLDFSDENAAKPAQSGSPPAVKRPSLVPDKYARKVAATGPGLLEDPLAARTTTRREPRPFWLGARLGAGMFDEGGAPARVGGAVAAAARFPLDERFFIAARVDWSRRGGDAGEPLDVLGASAGAGATLVGGALGLALIAQLRGDLRLADTRGTMAVRRTGASAALGVELALPATPLTAGLRFEQGLTELVPGARDRALLVEVGVDWR